MKGIIKYIKEHATKKNIIIVSVVLGVLLLGYLSWELIFSRYYIFHKYEKKFLEEVKSFYYYHPEYLPKEGNTRTKTLGELYEENRLEELKVPKRNSVCDLDSWVRVYNDNGTYKYNVYLVCGNIKSRTDHTGPEITLNGDSTIYISLNDEYKELGVKSVKDNKDGKMDVDKVVIDSSKVNTKKLGEYVVTYKIKDKKGNSTTVERIVKVTRNLTSIVKEDTKNTDGYYKGRAGNNYVLFSGMLFRIIKVNEDGTLLALSEDNIANLRMEEENYKDSNVDKYLNNIYLKAIYNDSYIVENDYCVGTINDLNDISSSCNEKNPGKVSLLSIDEFKKSFDDKGNSYLCGSTNFALSNHMNGTNINVNSGTKECLSAPEENTIPVIKPVITLKDNLPLTSGQGTISNPYKLEDYSYAKVGDTIENRLIGEYVNYSNINFRILEKNDKGIVLIAADGLKRTIANDSTSTFITATLSGNEYSFDVKDNNNIGYLLNNNYIDYINESNIISSEYIIPVNDKDKEYSELSKTLFESKISLPKTYDLFSSSQLTGNGYMYLYLDKSTDNKVFYLNSLNGLVYEGELGKGDAYCLRPVITVSKDLIIKKGKGTAFEPYNISNR